MPNTRLSTGGQLKWQQVHQTLTTTLAHVNTYAFPYCLGMVAGFLLLVIEVGR